MEGYSDDFPTLMNNGIVVVTRNFEIDYRYSQVLFLSYMPLSS